MLAACIEIVSPTIDFRVPTSPTVGKVVCLHTFAMSRERCDTWCPQYRVSAQFSHFILKKKVFRHLQHGAMWGDSKEGIPHGLTAGTDTGELHKIHDG